MANWILPLILGIGLWLAWSNRGEHAKNACFRVAAPLLPSAPPTGMTPELARAMGERDNAAAAGPAAWKPVAAFCDGLAAEQQAEP